MLRVAAVVVGYLLFMLFMTEFAQRLATASYNRHVEEE